MALKNYNPTTPSRRALVLVDKSEIYKGKPLKKLTKGLSKSGGRNNRGRIKKEISCLGRFERNL